MENLMIETQTNGMVPVIEEWYEENIKANVMVVHNLDFTTENDGTCQVYIDGEYYKHCEYENLSCELYELKLQEMAKDPDCIKNIFNKYLK